MRLFIEDFLYSNQAEFKKLDGLLPDSFTVEQFLTTELASKAPNPAVALAMLHFYSYHRFRGKLYEVGEAIANTLLRTSCETSKMSYPSREIIILMPPDFLKISDEESFDEIMTLVEGYVHFESSKNVYVMFVSNCDNKRGMASFSIDLEKGFDYFTQQASIHEISAANRKLWSSYFEFLCNVITYANTSNCVRVEKNPLSDRLFRLKSPGKIKKLERKLQAQGTLEKYILQ